MGEHAHASGGLWSGQKPDFSMHCSTKREDVLQEVDEGIFPDPLKDQKIVSPPQYEPITTLGKLGNY